jgi:hypothetical protein
MTQLLDLQYLRGAYDSTAESMDSSFRSVSECKSSNETKVLVNTALLARIETLEAENNALKKKGCQ